MRGILALARMIEEGTRGPCGPTRDARMSRHGGPDAPRAAELAVEEPRALEAHEAVLQRMAVQTLHALQNGFMGFERSGLFYGEFSGERVQIPIACWLVRASDAIILFDTGLSPRAVPGLMRNDPMARFTEADLLVKRLDALGLEPDNVDLVRSEEHTSELQSHSELVCRLL